VIELSYDGGREELYAHVTQVLGLRLMVGLPAGELLDNGAKVPLLLSQRHHRVNSRGASRGDIGSQ
jgi:hypothetical protein